MSISSEFQKSENALNLHQASKALSYLLRHGAVKERVPISDTGMVTIDDAVAWLRRKGHRVNAGHIHTIVADDSKGRYRVDGESICAVQGHSMTLKVAMQSWTEAGPLIHCSYMEHYDPIAHEGLKRMTRQHVHMISPDIETGASWNLLRRNSNLFVVIDSQSARNAGIAFLRADNGVILSEGLDGIIPPEHLTLIPAPRKTACYGFIVRCGSKILMVQTPRGVYGYPKGKRHRGEHSLACAFRELYEESGLVPSQLRLASQTSEEINEKGNCPTVYFHASVSEEYPVSCLDEDEGLTTCWMEISDARNIPDTQLYPRRKALI